jgi:hypothetical protein
MPFVPNIPQPTDFLSDSQEDLRQNNLQLDTSFGIDHYTFSNLTTDNGKHNQVTTPKVVNNPATPTGHPTTTATDMKFYAMQDTAPIGLLQYSRGWDAVGSISGVPSPVSFVQSPNTAQVLGDGINSVVNILDFTGITQYAIGKIIIWNKDTSSENIMIENTFTWNGTASAMTFHSVINTFPASIKLEMNANIMRLRRDNTGLPGIANLYWSIEFYRIVV